MKVIDILNKIANGEEVVFKINKNTEFEYFTKGDDLYFKYNDSNEKEAVQWYIYKSFLNEEVTIIEENNKIEKLGYISYNEKNLDIAIIKLAQKINELVEELNKLKELNNG